MCVVRGGGLGLRGGGIFGVLQRYSGRTINQIAIACFTKITDTRSKRTEGYIE